jgi:hypothetical protein
MTGAAAASAADVREIQKNFLSPKNLKKIIGVANDNIKRTPRLNF